MALVTRKTVLRIVKAGVFVCVLTGAAAIGGYFYIALSWKAYVKEEAIAPLVQAVNTAPRMSGEFYSLYDRLYEDRCTSMKGVFFRALISERYRREKNYYYKVAGFYFPGTLSNRKNPVLRTLDVAFALEHYTSPEKCFDYYMSRSDRETRLLPPIYELSDTTGILERMISLKAPSYYRMHPEKLNEGVEHLKAKL